MPTAIVPHKFQLCIRDEGLAEEFYDGGINIEKVVFFPRLALSVNVGRQSQSSFQNMTVHPNGTFHALAVKNGIKL